MASNDLPRTNPFAAALNAQRRNRADLVERFLGPAKTEDARKSPARTTDPQAGGQTPPAGTA